MSKLRAGALVLSVFVLLATGAGAATFRINANVESAKLSLYNLHNLDFYDSGEISQYVIEDPNDPLLENLESAEYLDVDFLRLLSERFGKSTRGTLVVKEASPYDEYVPVACTGIFAGTFCRSYQDGYSPFRLDDISYTSGYYYQISGGGATFFAEETPSWQNELGRFIILGMALEYSFSEFSIMPVPIPASGPFLSAGAVSLLFFNLLRRMRRSRTGA